MPVWVRPSSRRSRLTRPPRNSLRSGASMAVTMSQRDSLLKTHCDQLARILDGHGYRTAVPSVHLTPTHSRPCRRQDVTTFDDLIHELPEGRFDGVERPYAVEDVLK